FSTVLDLGCGNGDLMCLLNTKKQVQTQGIEIDEQSICDCVGDGLSVFQQDIDTGLSEYVDESFDYVILSQTLHQVKKPDFVLKEALRVGKQVIVSFPNFVYYPIRFQIFFKGKVPVTASLPHEWYETPNLHFVGISDFINYCYQRKFLIKKKTFLRNSKKVHFFPNFFAEIGIFLITN
ncbi:methionine biosynthesis protein MetW, partial [Candidatus Bathyarchaeota archaeon]|nr:methionine biosynthesis protein MetW [Candidatus Bathyarchaeota archaeon]